MKINTTYIVKDLNSKDMTISDADGSNVRPMSIGEVVSSVLIANLAGGKMKMIILAEKFYTQEEVEVDLADLDLIKKALEDTKIFTSNLPAARTLQY